MKYYSVFLPIIDPEKSEQFHQKHEEYIRKMRRERKIFASGRFTDGSGGLVIYMAESFEQVKLYVKRDPYVLNQARDYEIHEWEMGTSILNE